MSSDTTVYRLSNVTDIPEYYGIAVYDTAPREADPRNVSPDFQLTREGKPVCMRDRWNPLPRASSNGLPPWLDSAGHQCVPIFSLRAVSVLRDLLEPNGELLPLPKNVGDFFAFNVITLADVLDTKQSDVDWGLDYKYISKVRRHIFFPDRLDGLSIFRVPKDSLSVYVTDIFTDRIREHQLEGFALMKVWPLTDDEDWWELQRTKLRYWEDKAKRLRKTKSPDEPLLETWRDI